MPRFFFVIFCLFEIVGIGLLNSGASATVQASQETRSQTEVILQLNADALPAGKYSYNFLAGYQSNGKPLYVPVVVIKGPEAGQRMLLTAAVHGDELNGIAVINALVKELGPEKLRGTIIAVPGLNQTGLVGNSRYYLRSEGGGSQRDLNRLFPGTLTEGGAASRYAGNLWHNLLKGNADIAVDLHTQSTGSDYPLFVFADFRNRKIAAMATALMPDMIKRDSGQKGSLETSFVTASIPAVTFEIGGAKRLQQALIDRAVMGIKNLMVAEGMLAGTVIKPLAAPYVGSSFANIYAEEGGTALMKVSLREAVKKGDLLAIMLDRFGVEKRRYFAPRDGRVVSVTTDPLKESGAMLVRLLY